VQLPGRRWRRRTLRWSGITLAGAVETSSLEGTAATGPIETEGRALSDTHERPAGATQSGYSRFPKAAIAGGQCGHGSIPTDRET
jgi:hypothetical protein